MSDLDDIFEEEAARQRKQAEADDANVELQARIKAKRDAEIKREIAAGVRDADGHLIETEEVEDDGEPLEDDDDDA